MQIIHFWNGNKTSARQAYETELLEACLSATAAEFGVSKLKIDNTDCPLAEDEGNVFDAGTDILVTVAGNVKFKDKLKIMINRPLTKGLLGYRLLLVRDESLPRFCELNDTTELKTFAIGIPETWADAEIFRQNKYTVVEKGSIDDLFTQLKERAFDYTALGVNEIESAFEQRVEPLGGISIEPSLMLYYPFPLVFYVNHNASGLAARVHAGLNAICDNGEYQRIFAKHHGDVVNRLQLRQRRILVLENPLLPDELADFKPTLMD